jgi:regulator of vacuolar morphogenesis
MGDANGSRSSSVEAKRLLKDVGIRLEGLEKGLTAIGSTGGLGDGEKRRREEMVENMKAERGNLQRMAEAGVRTSGFSRPGIGDAGGGSAGSTGGNGTMPGGTASPWGPPPPSTGRVFGSRPVPSETVETRPLDDRGLLQLQQTKMAGQDAQLGELSKVLVRQREMGEVIAKEIGEQNELLEELEGEVDRTGRKLGRAKREMNRLG